LTTPRSSSNALKLFKPRLISALHHFLLTLLTASASSPTPHSDFQETIEIADLAFAHSHTTVTTTITAYWDCLRAPECGTYRQQAVPSAEKLSQATTKALEIGHGATDVTAAPGI